MRNSATTSIVIFTILALPCIGATQRSDKVKLESYDRTEKWKYPYQAQAEKKQKLLDLLNSFKDPQSVDSVFGRLGMPDRVEDLTKQGKPLSHFEDGFVERSLHRFAFRCVWFVRKASKSPGLGDSWLAAYVDKNGSTISVVHSNWLKK